MAGRTCNTQNTPREIPNPVSLTRNPSSWSSPCIVHTWLQRSARSRSDNRVLIRGWNKNELKVLHTRRMTDILRDSFFQLLASRTCRLWCDRNQHKSSPRGLIPSSLIPTALKSAIELFFIIFWITCTYIKVCLFCFLDFYLYFIFFFI